MIDFCIDKVSAAHMDETAALLSIARIDLLARLHGVGEQELENLGAIRNGPAGMPPAD